MPDKWVLCNKSSVAFSGGLAIFGRSVSCSTPINNRYGRSSLFGEAAGFSSLLNNDKKLLFKLGLFFFGSHFGLCEHGQALSLFHRSFLLFGWHFYLFSLPSRLSHFGRIYLASLSCSLYAHPTNLCHICASRIEAHIHEHYVYI